jgi:hypothetical protein
LKDGEDELRRFLWKNRIPSPINITLTEKQSFNGFKIDDISSDRNFRHFKNVLNTNLFGNGYRRFGKKSGCWSSEKVVQTNDTTSIVLLKNQTDLHQKYSIVMLDNVDVM